MALRRALNPAEYADETKTRTLFASSNADKATMHGPWQADSLLNRGLQTHADSLWLCSLKEGIFSHSPLQHLSSCLLCHTMIYSLN